MDSVEFLDAVKATHGLPSDRKLGQFLDIPNGKISMFRNRKRKLDPAACRKIAKALEVPSAYVLAEIQAERAKLPEDRADWKLLAGLAKKGQAAGLALLAITGLLTSFPQDARAGAAAEAQFFGTGIYIMRIWLCVQWLLRRCREALIYFRPIRSVSARASVTRISRGQKFAGLLCAPVALGGAA